MSERLFLRRDWPLIGGGSVPLQISLECLLGAVKKQPRIAQESRSKSLTILQRYS